MEDDATLVQEAVDGSLAAFTAICSRHEVQVHTFALALLRDRKAALDVVNDTFAEASERLETLQEPYRLIVWLLAIARYRAAQAAQAANTTAGPDRYPELPTDDLQRAHLISLVWEATADLPIRERALLDLTLRHGLEGDNLADALGVSPGEAAELQARMPELEKGLVGYLIMKGDDRSCGDLPLVLRGWDGHFTPVVADGIAAHVSSCRVCEQARQTLPAPFSLYASALPAPLPGEGAAWREEVGEALT